MPARPTGGDRGTRALPKEPLRMPNDPSWSLAFPAPDVALLQIDTPGRSVNLLSQAVLDELAGWLDQLAGRPDLAGLIIGSGKPGNFSAGVDLAQTAAAARLPRDEIRRRSQHGQEVLGRLSELPWVTVAAVAGHCLGGGAELACWCDRRVVADTPATEIGFPEVTLGLIPGWGGTVRFPRLVGLGNAAEWIATGERFGAAQAAACGWADDAVPADRLLEAAIAQIREAHRDGRFRDDRRRRSGPLEISDPELQFLRDAVRATVERKIFLHHAAPYVAIDVLIAAARGDQARACQIESDAFARLFGSREHLALLNVFFLAERNKRGTLLPANTAFRPIGSVGVIGAGIMGTGIAAASVKHELRRIAQRCLGRRPGPRRAGGGRGGRLRPAEQRPRPGPGRPLRARTSARPPARTNWPSATWWWKPWWKTPTSSGGSSNAWNRNWPRTPSWPPTPRPSPSRGWPRPCSSPNACAGCTSSIPCGT